MKQISVVCLVSVSILTSLLSADKDALSDILKKAGDKEIRLHTVSKKSSKTEKSSAFVFKETLDVNLMHIQQDKKLHCVEKSKSFDYENKSKFKFEFKPGTGQNNIVPRQAASSGGSGKGRSR
jgi:hypothetical protein